MSDLSNAALLALAWFGGLNGACSAAAWWLARRLRPPAGAGMRPLAVRLMPAAVSTAFVAVVFAPAHWRFEPRGADESFGLVVHGLALLGAAILLRAAWRGLAVLRAGWGLRACDGLPRIATPGGLAVYEVDGFASVSLAGVLRPRVLVGRAVRRVLTRRELEAAVAHELAHRESRDNWKRLAIYCAPDLFGCTAASRRLESWWSAAAECRADARAVAGSPARAADLASALVKVARLGARGANTPAWSTLHDEPLLAARVRRLVGAHVPAPPRPPAPLAGAAWTAAGVLLALAGLAAGRQVHLLTETIAHFLP